jgi:hypothetical protein
MSAKKSKIINNLLPSLPAALLIALTSTACESTMTAAGSQVRDLTGQDVRMCRFIQVVEASEIWGNSKSYTANRSAINKLRNKVSDVGGNAFTVDKFHYSITQNVIQAQALRCSLNQLPTL